MTRIVADEALWEQFSHSAEPVEICDERGRVIARLFPEADLPLYVPQISPEEWQRRREESEYSTAEAPSEMERP